MSKGNSGIYGLPTKGNNDKLRLVQQSVVVFDYPRYVWNRFSRARIIVGRATNCIACPDQRVMTNKKEDWTRGALSLVGWDGRSWASAG
jgi:hypothetical protein